LSTTTQIVNVSEICERPLPLGGAAQGYCLESNSGAVVSFAGVVRGSHQGRNVKALHYQAHQIMAEAEMRRINAEALEKFTINGVETRHRVGELEVGEVAVMIHVYSTHRRDAFLACEYVIDELKQRAPIWKKEFYTDGHSEWIENCCAKAHKETSDDQRN